MLNNVFFFIICIIIILTQPPFSREKEPPSLIEILLIHSKAWLSAINPLIFINSISSLFGLLDCYNFPKDNYELSFERKKRKELKVNGVNLSVCYFKLKTNKENENSFLVFPTGYGYTGLEAKYSCASRAFARLKSVEEEYYNYSREKVLKDKRLKPYYAIFGEIIFGMPLNEDLVSDVDVDISENDETQPEKNLDPIIDYAKIPFDSIINNLPQDIINLVIEHIYGADEDEGQKIFEKGFIKFTQLTGIRYNTSVENRIKSYEPIEENNNNTQSTTITKTIIKAGGGKKKGKKGGRKNKSKITTTKIVEQRIEQKNNLTPQQRSKQKKHEIEFVFDVTVQIQSSPVFEKTATGSTYEEACNLVATAIFKYIARVRSKMV